LVCVEDVKDVIDKEEEQIRKLEMAVIPESMQEFKSSKYFILPSMIRKYHGFLPNARPVTEKTFKGEQIFSKEEVTELHTKERWRKLQRQVRQGEEPVKIVKGLYNDGERMAELYGYWQTERFVNALTEEGKIPEVSC